MRLSHVALVLAVFLATPLAEAKAPQKEKHTAHHQSEQPGETVGIASWYGKEHQGKTMSNGKPFDRFKFTAASRTLPFGTRITVRNLKNEAEVVVTITDRGPWIKTRILDLSEAAAKAISCQGTCTVEYALEAEVQP